MGVFGYADNVAIITLSLHGLKITRSDIEILPNLSKP